MEEMTEKMEVGRMEGGRATDKMEEGRMTEKMEGGKMEAGRTREDGRKEG